MVEFNKFIIANWKMNGTVEFLSNFMESLISNNNFLNKNIIICPPFVFLSHMSKYDKLNFGAQDCSIYNEDGAYTGEVSCKMIANIGCNYVIVGHSERIKNFNETDDSIKTKAANCHICGIIPIICIGETLEDRNLGKYLAVIEAQLISRIPKSANVDNIIIAYEPIWAIGTGKAASCEEIDAIHTIINQLLNKIIKSDPERIDKQYKIVYGGSVNSENINNILSIDSVNGVLIGGASLKLTEFESIINYKKEKLV